LEVISALGLTERPRNLAVMLAIAWISFNFMVVYFYNRGFCVHGQDIISLKCKRLIINDLRTTAGRGGVSVWK
jgi:hypothetical protein